MPTPTSLGAIDNFHDEPSDECRREDPDQDDHRGRDLSRPCRPSHNRLRFLTALRKDLRRDHPDHKHDPQGDEDQVVQVPKNGNEIRDQVDRGEGIAEDEEGKGLRIPGDAGVAIGEI